MGKREKVREMLFLLFSALSALPLAYLFPCPLVDGVVDRYYGAHVFGFGIIALAPHRVEEHAFGRVDPVSGCCVGVIIAAGGISTG